MGMDPLVRESLEALGILAESSHYSQLKGAERAGAESDGRLRKRTHAFCGELVVVGGSDGGSYLKSAEMYDTSAGQWRALPDMSVERWGCAAVCIEGHVYVVGGSDGTTRHASVECYDPIANEWCTLPSMSAARCFCAAAMGEMGRTHG